MPKSNSKSNWFSRLGTFFRGNRTQKDAKPNAKRLRMEQLESRRVFATVLLDVPGINGDTTAQGATPTDMELSSFQWGFSRTGGGARASLADPIKFQDLTFQRTTDSASNDLYAQTALQTLDAKPAKLRLVEGGATLLKFDLSNSRFTKFATKEGQSESGALSFSNLAFTESFTATPRTANWNLLTGAASSSAIVGQTGIDPTANSLNIETVMQIGTQKMLINGFSWNADLDVDLSLANPLSSLAEGTNFKITRGVDSATAGLLGSAAAGTVIPEIKISDRSVVAGKNQVTMEWTLSNAFVAGFGLKATNNAAPTNDLELSYGRIELKVHQFDKTTGIPTNTETTTWDEAGNIVTATTDFGIANPSLVNNTDNSVISSLNFGAPAGSTTALGSLAYASIDWAVSNARNLSGTTNEPTKLSAMTVALPAAQNAPAPALLGQLAKRSQLATVSAFEKNTAAPTSALDTFSLSNVYVTGFSVENEGLADTEVSIDLDFRSFSEAFTDRTTPATPLNTTANFNVQTQASAGVLSFGGKTIDTNFELVITEAGVISEIPVLSAGWSIRRETPSEPTPILVSAAQTDFTVDVPRGVHSPGLLAAAVRGTEIDSVSVRRYEIVNVGGTPTKKELYRWDLTKSFITGVGMTMRPGNATEEVDSLSLLPGTVQLVMPHPTAQNPNATQNAGWNFIINMNINASNAAVDNLLIEDPALRFKPNGAGEGIAIESYQWGANLPVENTTSSGNRPLGNPSPQSLLLKPSKLHPILLGSALLGIAEANKPQKITLPPLAPEDGARLSYELALTTAAISGFSYSDAITADRPETSLSVFTGGTADLQVTPITTTGTADTTRRVTWKLSDDTTTNFNGLGNFQFATNQEPATTLDIFNGTSRARLAADSYSFGIDNALNQLVGTSTANVSLAARGNPSAKTFDVTTSLDRATPGLLNAIATKTLIPEIKITERRTVNGQLLPWREWSLTNVYITTLANQGTKDDPQGEVTLQLNAASATAKFITYNAANTPTTITTRLNFADPPAISSLPVTAIATDPDRVLNVAARFTDRQLQYSVTVLSGANLFDGVSINAANQLVLNFKPGQKGFGQIRVIGTNAFGLRSALLVNVNVDSDGLPRAPAGTNKTVTFNEDTTYIIRTSDFGFTDPDDFPANTLTGVRITTLPAVGSLKLNGVAITANQTIPVANLNANQLRFTPAANAHGTNLASFTFQVQDNGATSNLDLTPKLFTFNVTNTNDAPTFTSTSVVMPAVAEDSTSHNGMLVSSIVSVITDVDPGALKGIAIVEAPTTFGTWQYALNGTTWQSLTGASTNAARLLAADATTRVRFLPNANASGPSTLKFHAWDQAKGQAGGIGNFIEFAQFKTFSTVSANLNANVTAVNDAPTLNSATVLLNAIDEDTTNSAGTLVSSLLTGMSDVDSGAAKGIAIRATQISGGIWQYTLNNGVNWTALGSVSDSAARLLPANPDTRVRFLPTANFAADRSFSFAAWDQTSGTAGETANVSSRGGSTAFSAVVALAQQTINAVNDAPTIVAPNTAQPLLGSPLVFSAVNANAIRVGDIDAGSSVIQIAITVTNGQFNLSTLTGITITAGSNGSSALTARGTLVALNAALADSAFLPNNTGPALIRMVVDDLANTGSGGAKTVTKNIELLVALPSGTVQLGTLNATTPTFRRSGNRDGFTSTPDFYTFTLAAASDVRVNLSGLSGDLDLRVFNTGGLQLGQSLFFGTTIENILMTALPAGTYLIDVRSSVASAYDLTISTGTNFDDLITQASLLPTLNATTLPTIRQSSIGTSADLQDYHRFELTTASALRINLSNLSQDADIQLLDAAGRVIQTANVSDNTIENMLTSTLAVGTYYLRVFAGSGLLTSNYDLTISMNTSSDDLLTNATSLGLLSSKGSERRTANVAVGTDLQDYYVFAGGGDIAISLSGLTSDVDVQVLDRFGRVVAQSTNSGNTAESINVNIPSGSGDIYIRVFAFAGSSSYVLEARNNANAANADDLLSTATVLPTPLTSLTRTGAVGGTGSTGDPQDYYRFQLTSVRNIALTLTGLTADLDVELLDQFGNLLFFSRNGSTNNESINVANLAIGTYFIRIHPFGAAISNYTLGLAVS